MISPPAANISTARCQCMQRSLPILSTPAAYERNPVRPPLRRSFPPCRYAVFSLSNPCFLSAWSLFPLGLVFASSLSTMHIGKNYLNMAFNPIFFFVQYFFRTFAAKVINNSII
jgi:hypothetical protein